MDEAVKNIREKGGNAVGVVADVCSAEDTKRVIDTALKEFGNLGILINNAGIGEQYAGRSSRYVTEPSCKSKRDVLSISERPVIDIRWISPVFR